MNRQNAISEWLGKNWQKKDVSNEHLAAIDAAIGNGATAVRAALEGIGIAIAAGKVNRFEKVVLPQLLGKLPPKPAQPLSVHHEQVDTAESLLRIEQAVAEAVGMGIVREEIFHAQEQTGKRGYLLSSSHYAVGNFDPDSTKSAIKQSQIEAFQLMHLFNRHRVIEPMFVEGTDWTQTYEPFKNLKFTFEKDGTSHHIHSPEAQAMLFEHPRVLQAFFDAQQKIAQRMGTSPPIFYTVSSYPGFTGAHSAETDALLKKIVDDWLPWHAQMVKKYPYVFTEKQQSKGPVVHEIQTGWDRSGAPVMQLGDIYYFASDIIHDAQNYLRYADLMHEADVRRETEMTERMRAAAQDGRIPMAFAGKGHEFMIARRLHSDMDLHVLTPTSSVQFDHKRTTTPINDPKSSSLMIDAMQKLIQAAGSLKPRGVI